VVRSDLHGPLQKEGKREDKHTSDPQIDELPSDGQMEVITSNLVTESDHLLTPDGRSQVVLAPTVSIPLSLFQR
jgi:hypothetical protein